MKLDLLWLRAPDYRIKVPPENWTPPRPRRGRGLTDFGSALTIISPRSRDDEPVWIVPDVPRNEVPRHDHYHPLKIDGLYNRLLECDASPDGALKFAKGHGFLLNQARMLVGDFCEKRGVIKSLVDAADNQNWEPLHTWLQENPKSMLKPVLIAGLEPVLTTSRAALRSRSVTERQPSWRVTPELFFEPVDLYSAIVLQLLQDKISGARLRHCRAPGCDEWFKYGPRTEHRSTAKYCSTKCLKAHAYKKSKGED